MVCAKCTKAMTPTTLATSTPTSRKEMYYGSPASKSSPASSSSAKTNPYTTKKPTATINPTIGKSKLLSSSAKNPYAIYSATCSSKECFTKIDAGRKYCNKCAYRANACAVCGKANKVPEGKGGPVVIGQKFTLK